jgi:hypothetical protein
MDLAALLISAVSLLISVLAAWAALRSADEARKLREIESERRSEERAADLRLRLEWAVGQPQQPGGPSPTFMYYAVHNKGQATARDIRLEPFQALDDRPLPEPSAIGTYEIRQIDPAGAPGSGFPSVGRTTSFCAARQRRAPISKHACHG